MTKFNPEGKEVLTYGDCLNPAMNITDKADADQYFKEYVAHIQGHLDKEPNKDGMTAEQIARANLGYFAVYYDHETRLRVERLFSCSHPIFGNATSGQPSPKEAFILWENMVRHTLQHRRERREATVSTVVVKII